MTVKQLKQKLEAYPDDMDVFMAEVETGFKYSPVEEVRQQMLNYKEDPGGKTLSSELVIIIDSF